MHLRARHGRAPQVRQSLKSATRIVELKEWDAVRVPPGT